MTQSPDCASDEEMSEAPKHTPLSQVLLTGNLRMTSSISMLFTDILSKELNSALISPETMGTLQKHLHNQPLEKMGPSQIEPLMEHIPESVLDIVKEALFCSGAGSKRVECIYPLKVGDKFIFRGSGLMGDLRILDGRVTEIEPLKKR